MEVPLQDHLAARRGRKLTREPRRPERQTRELVRAPGELQTRKIGDVDSLRVSDGCENILEFVSEAISGEVGDPALR